MIALFFSSSYCFNKLIKNTLLVNSFQTIGSPAIFLGLFLFFNLLNRNESLGEQWLGEIIINVVSLILFCRYHILPSVFYYGSFSIKSCWQARVNKFTHRVIYAQKAVAVVHKFQQGLVFTSFR